MSRPSGSAHVSQLSNVKPPQINRAKGKISTGSDIIDKWLGRRRLNIQVLHFEGVPYMTVLERHVCIQFSA
jgi:hypothetical protein